MLNLPKIYYESGTGGLKSELDLCSDEELVKFAKRYVCKKTKLSHVTEDRSGIVEIISMEIKARANRGIEFGDYKLPE